MSRAPSLTGTDRAREVVRFADGVEVGPVDGAVRACRDGRSFPLRDAGLLAALHEGAEAHQLTRGPEEAGDVRAVLRTRAALTALDAAGFLAREVYAGGGLAA